jgi:two-component system phosphate regulon sensor histidine kinase PhoR
LFIPSFPKDDAIITPKIKTQSKIILMNSYLDVRSLPVQMILSFIGVVILTVVAMGIPAVWLIRQQLDRQAWSQVDQGRRAAMALYDAKRSEMEDLAILTAQRPTLRELLEREQWDALEDYLGTLKIGAGLDLVVVCDPTHNIITSTDSPLPLDLCYEWDEETYHILNAGSSTEVWLTATHPVDVAETHATGVLVGVKLGDDFASKMFDETGLEHTIWATGQPIATSFAGGNVLINLHSHQEIASRTSPESIYSTFELEDQPYYSAMAQLSPNDIHAEVALGVADIETTQRRMLLIMVSSILVVTVMGSILGIYLARRISKPLVLLADTAERFRRGNLSSSVAVDAQVREVAQVAQALESARVDLLRTLTNLEKEKAWINHLIESIVEGIMIIDSDGRITYFSQGAERITGWDRDEVIDRACDDVFRLPERQAAFSQLIPVSGGRSKLVVELAGGQQATLAITQAHLAPLEAGDAEIVLVFRDVSEGEIMHRTLGDFLANIAHEFRTPLSAAAASIELLIDQTPDLSYAEIRELLNALHLGILSLQNLVDNLLESASIEAGRFRISPRSSDIAEIISKAVQTMQPLLVKYGQNLVVELPTDIPVVYADARRVEQVLVNLVSNASKYGPADAEITISVLVDHTWAKIQVADRGPGVSQEQRKHVFRRFMYPGSLSESAKVGAGLGLSVVKAVVEAHNGQVGVDDRPGGGSIFWFTLPLEDKG